MNKDLINKSCVSCKHFESFKDAYFDDLEPDYQGFCRHPNGAQLDGAGFDKVCDLWETPKEKDPE